MEFFACIALIAFMVWLCKKDEWKANNRVSPPGMKTDWGKMSEDRILKGMSQRDIYKKQNQGGYDVPIKRDKAYEDWRKRHDAWKSEMRNNQK